MQQQRSPYATATSSRLESRAESPSRVFHQPIAEFPRIFCFWLRDLPDSIGSILSEGDVVEPSGKNEQIIAQGVQQAIQAAGYRSADEFASAIGMPRSTLSRILNGKGDPRMSTLTRIAEALSLTLNDFLLLPNPAPAPSDLHRLRTPGRPQREDIRVQITIPAGVEIPGWLQDVLLREAVAEASPKVKHSKRRTAQTVNLRLAGSGTSSASLPSEKRDLPPTPRTTIAVVVPAKPEAEATPVDREDSSATPQNPARRKGK